MWAALTKHWFLTALAVCFVTGYLAAEPLQPWLQPSWIRGGVMLTVIWAMGVTLRAETIRRSLANPRPAVLAIGINLLIVPLLALPAVWWLPESMYGGLFVAAMVPCTLAGASVWTRKAGGDDSVSMMTTVVTNLACVVVVPCGIWLVLSEQVQIDAISQFKKLSLLVVAPLVVAQFMRRMGCRGWADRYRGQLSVLAQLGILVMVLLGAAASGVTTLDSPVVSDRPSWWAGFCLLVTVLGIHLSALAFGVFASRSLGMSRARQIAVGISGSQKTLMVGLQIAIDCGVSVVPMLIYHVGQLALDTLIAQRWRRNENDAT
ncbi:MAG: bile acid:sodium symporter [Rubripirellula sp.]|nr:bile acid:sodium symporter [Rubripirellula sp.]